MTVYNYGKHDTLMAYVEEKERNGVICFWTFFTEVLSLEDSRANVKKRYDDSEYG